MQKHILLKLAKNEKRHAEENMQKQKEAGNTYSVNVYKVRIKALELLIKVNTKTYENK